MCLGLVIFIHVSSKLRLQVLGVILFVCLGMLKNEGCFRTWLI